MARGTRLDSPGSIHHVMGHSIQNEVLFPSQTARRAFIARLGMASERTGCVVIAWALMGSHFHLLVRTGEKPMWKLMHLLLTSYALWFNSWLVRRGHVMRGRYRSILIDTDRYLLEVIRYIHLNPLRAGYVQDLDRLVFYKWCGHSSVITGVHPAWQDIEAVRRLFGMDDESAVSAYLAFLNEEGSDTYSPETPLILGSGGLISNRRSDRSLDHDTTREHIAGDLDYGRRISRELEPGIRDRFRKREDCQAALEGLFKEIEDRFGVKPAPVLGGVRTREVSLARAYAAWILTSVMGFPSTTAARILHLTAAGVYLAVKRWERSNSMSNKP